MNTFKPLLLSFLKGAVVLTLLSGTAASAQTYNVDFNIGYTDTGAAASPVNPLTMGYSALGSGLQIYNSIAQAGLYGRKFELHAGTTSYAADTLYDSGGNASSINFTNQDLGSGGANVGEYNNGGNGDGYQQGGTTATPPTVFPNYITNNNNGTPTTLLTITFNGLAANTVYNVAAYDVVTSKGTAARTSFFNVNGGPTYSLTTTGSNDTALISTATTPYATGDHSYTGNYVLMQGTSTASGTLTLSFWGTPGAESDFSGMSLQATTQTVSLQKPAPLALLVTGMLMLGLMTLLPFRSPRFRKVIGVIGVTALFGSAASAQSTFSNPVIPPTSADPFITFYNGNYYAVRTPSYGGVVDLYISPTLGGLKTTSPITLFNLGDFYESPELFFINGNWYIYCTTPDSGKSPSNNIHVLMSSGTDPKGPYTSQGIIESSAYDGDILQMNGTNYFLSSPSAVLYIQQMSSPTTLMGSHSTLAVMDQVWEQQPSGGATFNLMEAPEAVHHNNDYFIFYTNGDYQTQGYMVGVLKYQGGSPLLASSWKKLPGPLFLGNMTTAIAAGDCTPFQAANGTWWFTYSAFQNGSRSVRVQPMSWDANGNPVFPPVDDLTQTFVEPAAVPPMITSAAPGSTAAEGVPFSFTYTATGAPAPTFTLTSGSLPTGLTLSSAGVISGIPTSEGTFTGVVTASNGFGTAATQTFTITISGVDTPTMPVWGLAILAFLLLASASRLLPRLSPD